MKIRPLLSVNTGTTETGRRIKKRAYTNNVPTEETIFVYDAAEKLIGEYSTVVASTNDAKVAYLTNDHLGSPRINTDANGSVTARHDYHPFGEEIATDQRTTGLGYIEDTIRKQFTGYERDNETDLDFAQTRYFSSRLGRFTTVDPLQASARSSTPQTWNRYIYTLNNPSRFVDPDGMDVQLLDTKARNNVLMTLPKDIRDKVASKINDKGLLTKGALDKIQSKDANFVALKGLVNNKALTEVMTAAKVNTNSEFGTPEFHKYTAGENRERDIKDYMKLNSVSRKDAETFFKGLNITWEDTGFYGWTLVPSKSPTNNLRIVVTDQTGDASTVSDEEAVTTTGHELYGHGSLFSAGKPWEHGKAPEATFTQIEERTRANFRSSESSIKNNPSKIKPTKP